MDFKKSAVVTKIRSAKKPTNPATPEQIDSVQACLTDFLKLILKHPEDLKIEYICGPNTIVFEIDINLQDFGRLVGSKGKTIDALRTLALSASANMGFRSVINIKDQARFFSTRL